MEQNNTQKKGGKKLVFPIILSVVLVGGLIFGIKEYIYYSKHTTTDDAQVDADISPVVARATGYVKEIRFVDNQVVHAGDTLVVLDDRDYQLKVQQAIAALSSTKQSVDVSQQQVTEAQTSVATAQANVEAAKVAVWKANEDFARYENLYNDHAITKAQYDDAKAAKESAEAALTIAQTQVPTQHRRVDVSHSQVGATSSNLATRQADVDYARLQLSYTVITAPASGIVSKRNIQLGQLVQAGQTLFAVVNANGIYITANFKETQMEPLKIGQKVDISVDAYPDSTFHGQIESFSGATGAKFSLLPPDNATGNFVKVVQRVPVRIRLESDSSSSMHLLRPGMSVDVVVYTK
jgi:membrane fusion protein (multidrug efflux system)